MPWDKKNVNGKICVYKKTTGKILHCYSGEDAAQQADKYLAALHANMPKDEKEDLYGVKFVSNRAIILKAGNMAGLAKHLSKKLGGDPHFFTKCVGDESVVDYDTEVRNAICARAHKMVTGHYPAEDKKIENKEYSMDDVMSAVRNEIDKIFNPSPNNAELAAVPNNAYTYIDKIYDDYVIIKRGMDYFKVPYTIDENLNVVIDNSFMEAVEPIFVPIQKEKYAKFVFDPDLMKKVKNKELPKIVIDNDEDVFPAAAHGVTHFGEAKLIVKEGKKIVAKRGNDIYLVVIGGNQAVIVNKQLGTTSKPQHKDAFLKFGYWEAYTGEPDTEVLGLV